MQQQMKPALVTEAEARRYLGGISRALIYRLRADGSLPVIHLGRACRYRLADLDRAIEALSHERAGH